MYWFLAVFGLVLAFLALYRKLRLWDSVRIMCFALGTTAVILGGGSIIANKWGNVALGIWALCCLALLAVLRKQIRHSIPILKLADQFEKTTKDK